MGGQPVLLSDDVLLACKDQVNRSTRRSTPASPMVAALLVVVFGHSVSVPRMIAWAVFVSASAMLAMVVAMVYLSRRAHDAPVGRWLIGPAAAGLAGFSWGSLSLFVFPAADHYELRALYLIVLCGVSATSAVGAAASRSYFFPFQLALLLPVDLVCLLAHDHPTQVLGLAIPVFMAVIVVLHQEVHSVVLSELHLRERNADVNEQLLSVNTELSEIALRDDLTGVANRFAFVDALGKASSDRDRGLVGVVFLDLDRFKAINDSMGHQAGDELLIQVATRIRQILRDDDVLARLGGDEFTMLLRGLRDEGEALAMAHRIHRSFETPFVVNDHRILVTASLGVTVHRDPTERPQDLLSQADTAQYHAKENGRNRVEAFIPTLRPIFRRRLDHEEALRQALVEGQIVAYFQPQVELSTGRIVGAEALARWNHPARGVLTAADFVPLAEESDLILEIDAAVRRDAIGARAELARAGCGPDFRVWCNISARQLAIDGAVTGLVDELYRLHCSPGEIGIELTETAVMANLDDASRQIDEIRSHGIKVALDDFGTGQSSLAVLMSMTVDELKVDKSFVLNMEVGNRNVAIVRAMAALGGDLGLIVVAEGVETLNQAALVRTLHCDHGQGFLWSGAVPLEELCLLVQADFWRRTTAAVAI